MASTIERKSDGSSSGRRPGPPPPTEEERRQHETEYKQELLEEYRKRYGNALISSEQTWELYEAIDERWHAKMKERLRSPPHSHSPPPHHGDHPPHHGGPHHLEEIHQQIHSELQHDFQKDFTTAHGTNNINIDQAWLLIQKVQHNKHEKLEANRQKHRHGPEEHRRHSPPGNP